ncbi:MAG: hypothetical protein COV70_01520 [Parcubacteria group bacterium CG11_big_fil_rev_8_21_14_0_20_39_22]|nr:MAG: hypothetical protein COV70_01520 [Parcubacteria group bacterium CG11_big_fil_rev_8_21_14_0_20_39_22]
MNKNNLYLVVAIILSVIVVVTAVLYKNNEVEGSEVTDEFVACLNKNEVVMYGAYWCPHCDNQKKLFRDKWENVSYVECTEDPNLCIEKEIKGYPTWIIGDNKYLVGVQSMESLAQATGCEM